MKKYVFLLLAAVSACFASAAGSSDNDVEATSSNDTSAMTTKINVKVNGYTLVATLVDNASTRVLIDMMKQGEVSIDTHMYGNFEQTGNLPQSITSNDSWISVGHGDIVLYRGIQVCFYYDENEYSFTRLGRIDNANELTLKSIYGEGNTTFVLSLPSTTGFRETAATSAEVIETAVYTTDGKLLANSVEGLSSGMYVVKQTMSDGSIQSKTIKL